MGEIRGRLLIGGMVLRNLEASLDHGAHDSESGWTGSLLIDPPQQESLQVGRPYRLELDDKHTARSKSRRSNAFPASANCEPIFGDAPR